STSLTITAAAAAVARTVREAALASTAALALALLVPLFARDVRAELPAALSDAEFWQLVETLSEPEQSFAPQYMSNEDSLQFVMPELAARVEPGGAYIGVAAEQNFTYLATLRPEIAFIVDIRRDNLRQVLLYKALFELSPDRATFVARLFSRHRPARVAAQASDPSLLPACPHPPPARPTY